MANDIQILSLRGGQFDTDPSANLADDQCVLAENIEFFYSLLGERRAGCAPIFITGSGLETQMTSVHISQWFPANRVTAPDLFAITAVVGTSTIMAYLSSGAWTAVTSEDTIVPNAPDVYNIVSQPLNGKLFWAFPSMYQPNVNVAAVPEDRLHVWTNLSGTGYVLRRTGIAQPPPPTVLDEGIGAYSGIRYFRIRYIQENLTGQILNRSEPSTEVAFTPSGSGAGAAITQPIAFIGEVFTHWEIEASSDDANFYRIATEPVGTVTYDDTTDLSTSDYANLGPVSEIIGTYLTQGSARYLSVDGDRLLTAGHFTDPTRQSQITWSPVFNDPGVGNDERLPLQVNNTVNLDNYDGGPITGITSGVNGVWWAFKWSAIYQMTRTGDITRAYDVLTLTKSRGAINGSLVAGMDEYGAACEYFLDPVQGPSRIGPQGLQLLPGLRKTWGRVNLNAQSVVARGAFYPYKQQIHWWLAVDGSDTPMLKIVFQISEGPGRGWSTATGLVAQATAVGVYTEWVGINEVFSLTTRPVLGLTAPNFLQRSDTDTSDAGVPFRATLRTRPYILAGLLNKWGTMTASILATSNTLATLVVKFIKNYGVEESRITTNLAPVATEEYVIRSFDSLAMSNATVVQVEFTDP